MDSIRSEEEEERVVEDEFTCPGMLRGSLSSLHSSVQRIFRVRFSIGTDQPPQDAHGQIWLQLRGLDGDVQAAKLFVKGVVNQEEQQEVPYPLTLHCVFCGARGLFMDCLIRNTSALIVIGSPGRLLISGLLEPVVRAYSLITDLVERCDSTQPKRFEPGERGLGESLESRRAFKNLVEQWDDRHTLDLLVLPGSIKESLLELLKESKLGDNPRPLEIDGAKQDIAWDKSVVSFGESSGSSSFAKDTSANFLDSFGEPERLRGSPEGTEGNSKSPFSDNIRGPPLSSYSSNNSHHFANHQASTQANYSTTRSQNPHANGNDWSRDRRGQQGAVVVTGEQRFLEGLNSHFELRLTDSPGKEGLRNIIIDGSNVAMSHGLGHFFSCRGIALAVQHFWDRGHRQISVLLPQWRTKNDYRIKEQHYLTQLKELGIVSLTPSREVQGKRISSYDDRFMLQLAQKTEGVIVTNDNLRDLSDESAVWRDIIKKRLLQYTFVGDLFMVPDDPLGRGGPHLDESLDLSSHTYNTFSKAPHPNNEPIQTWTRPETEPGLRPGPRAERSPHETTLLRQQLCQVFPGQDSMVTLVLQSHPKETDINALSALLLEEN
uniref:Uncharacterized protein n=1 Tax=Periophthalmus magnuspinnatus TaxID=409849 RepID=A0A3B4AEY0_9GOBI